MKLVVEAEDEGKYQYIQVVRTTFASVYLYAYDLTLRQRGLEPHALLRVVLKILDLTQDSDSIIGI